MKEKEKGKKLLVFHPALAPYRIDLFNSLHKLYNAKFYFLNKRVLSQNFSQEKLRNASEIDINYLDKGFTLFGYFFRFGISELIKKEKPDIILCTEFSTITLSVYLLTRLLNRKIKVYTLTEDNVSMMENASYLQTAIRKFLLKRLDGIIVTHKEIQDYYCKKFNLVNNFIVFPTIRTEGLYQQQLQESLTYAHKNIKQYALDGKHVLLYVGRLVEVKNLKRLISAFNLVHNKNKNTVLVLVGEGDQEEELQKLVALNNLKESIIFTGRLEGPELLSWYNTANIFILPSTFEPFGAVINEALLAGCFALVSKTSGGACLVTDEINGKLFNPYDEGEIVNAISHGFATQKKVVERDAIKDSKMLIDYTETINELFRKLQ